jgi:hypothetical protein
MRVRGHHRGIQPDAGHPFQQLVRDLNARNGAVPGDKPSAPEAVAS